MKNRLFLALPAILDDYEAIQSDFAEVLKGRWVPPENLHLTLFIVKMFTRVRVQKIQ